MPSPIRLGRLKDEITDFDASFVEMLSEGLSGRASGSSSEPARPQSHAPVTHFNIQPPSFFYVNV